MFSSLRFPATRLFAVVRVTVPNRFGSSLAQETSKAPKPTPSTSTSTPTPIPTLTLTPTPTKVPAPVGVVAIARGNKRRRFFLASKENLFGGHKAEVVMVDSGCNTVLLPLRQGELQNLPKAFPQVSIDSKISDRQNLFEWEVRIGRGVSRHAPTLSVKRANGGGINFDLCSDLQRDLGTAVQKCSSDLLRFHLCTEDIHLLIGALRHYVPESSIKLLERYINSNPSVINRRTGALLGQSILSQYASIQYKDLLAIVDPKIHDPANWTSMEYLIEFLKVHSHLLPESFDMLEDDDHAEDRDIFSLGEQDYCDE